MREIFKDISRLKANLIRQTEIGDDINAVIAEFLPYELKKDGPENIFRGVYMKSANLYIKTSNKALSNFLHGKRESITEALKKKGLRIYKTIII